MMKRKPRSKKTASAIKQAPTRRSRRLSGLPPAVGMLKMYTTAARRRKSIKTPQKRTIVASYTKRKEITEKRQSIDVSIENTANTAGEIDINESDDEQIEGVPIAVPTYVNTVETELNEERNNIANQDDESSDNEQHDDEEKSSVLLDKETPKEEIEGLNTSENINKIESEMKGKNKHIYCTLFIFLCIFLLHLFSWLKISNHFVVFMLSFVFYTTCRYYLDVETEIIYIKFNAINAFFVLVSILGCFLSVLYGLPSDYELNFKLNEWLSFGLFMSHFCDDLYNLYYNNNANKWLLFGRQTMLIIFLVLFLFICDNAIDLVFVYCIKSLILAITMNMDMFHYTITKDIQLNIICIHFGAWLSITKIFKLLA